MRGLRVLILVCAAVSAMAAMWMMRSALQSQANAPAPVAVAAAPASPVAAPDTVDVLIAARQISTGRRLTLEDLRWQAWPTEAVSTHFYTQSEDPEAMATLEGSAARLTIVEGEPITSSKIVEVGGSGVMAALLRPGMRAVSLPISEITGAGGFILPGDFVDILITRQIDVEHVNEDTGDVERVVSHNKTETVMETVRVLAIDQQLNEGGQSSAVGNSATLELMPEQVEQITLTRQIAQQNRGFITLSLRSFAEMLEEYGEDVDKVLPRTVIDLRDIARADMEAAEAARKKFEQHINRTTERVAMSEEDGLPAPAAAAAAEEAANTVTLIRNGAPIVVHTIAPKQAGAK